MRGENWGCLRLVGKLSEDWINELPENLLYNGFFAFHDSCIAHEMQQL